jgi:rubredoxin
VESSGKARCWLGVLEGSLSASGLFPQQPMPARKRIDLAKVLTSLDVVCPECSCSIPPDQMERVGNEQMKCPLCDAVFDARSQTKPKSGPLSV